MNAAFRVDDVVDAVDAIRGLENVGDAAGVGTAANRVDDAVPSSDLSSSVTSSPGNAGSGATGSTQSAPSGQTLAATPEGVQQTPTALPQFVYRGGSNTPTNMTPRPGVDDVGDNPGLSTWTTPEAAAPNGGLFRSLTLRGLNNERLCVT